MRGKLKVTIYGKLLLLSIFAIPSLAHATDPSDAEALKGLSSAKAVFDITTAEPKKLNFYLNLIESTAKSMQAAGVKTEFVLAFRGPATFYTSMDRKKIKMDDMMMADKISAKLKSLSATPGMEVTQCAVAAHALKVDIKSINPAVKVIGNSWVSLIAYQNKGYAIVPVR